MEAELTFDDAWVAAVCGATPAGSDPHSTGAHQYVFVPALPNSKSAGIPTGWPSLMAQIECIWCRSMLPTVFVADVRTASLASSINPSCRYFKVHSPLLCLSGPASRTHQGGSSYPYADAVDYTTAPRTS